MAFLKHFVEGQWNVICQYCGREVKAGSTTKTWDGYRVCESHNASRNPLHFVKAVAEQAALPWRRGKPPEVVVGTGGGALSGLQVVQQLGRVGPQLIVGIAGVQ